MKRTVTVILATVFAIGLAMFPACKKQEETPQGSITAVSFSCDEYLFSGETVELRAKVETEGTVADKSVVWSVSGDAAEITQDGKLTLKTPGEITVTAKAKADETKSFSKNATVLEGGAPINGTFDRAGELLWGIFPDNPEGYEKSAEVKRDGKYSLKLTTTADYTIIYHAVTIGDGYAQMKAGGYYIIEAYAYSQAENGGVVKPRVNFQDTTDPQNKPTLGAVEATELTEANTWTRIASSTVRVPDNATSFNACVEFYGKGEIFIDSVRIVEVASNDVRLAELKVDGVQVSGYADNIDSYTVQVNDTENFEVTALPYNETTVVSVDKTESGATVKIVAEDKTERIIQLTIIQKQPATLTSLTVGGKDIQEFDTLRTEYYVMLGDGITEIPEITYTKADSVTVTETKPEKLPGYVVLTAKEGDVSNEYKIYVEARPENMYSLMYWNIGFEDGLTNWGTDGANVSGETSHSGRYSLKAEAGGKGGWMGFDLGSGMVSPSVGDTVKVGVWAYVTAADALEGNILIELREKENDVLAASVEYPVKAEDAGKWIFVETPVSSAITDVADYLQIVVKNFTNSVAYFDDVRVCKVDAEITEERVVDLSRFDPGFEGTEKKFESWATDPAFDTTVVHGGAQSLKIDAPENAGFKFVLNVGEDVQVGEVLTYSAWIYVESAEENVPMIKISALTASEEVYRTHLCVDDTRGEWVRLTVNYTVKEEDVQLLLIVGNDRLPAVYYVDDISLTAK